MKSKTLFNCLFIIAVLPLGGTAHAQGSSAKKFAAVINPATLRQHLEVVAGKETEGRETATAGERKAAAYIKDQFVKMGLKPGNGSSYLMPFTVYKDSVTEASLAVNGKAYRIDTEFGVYPDNNHTCDLKFSECVFAGYGISSRSYDEYKNLDVAGKLVVVYDGEPQQNGRYIMSGTKDRSKWSYTPAKVRAATGRGAAAVLVIQKAFPPEKYHGHTSDVYIDEYKFYQPANTFFISEKIAADLFGSKYGDISDGLTKDTLEKIKTVVANVALSYRHATRTLTSNNVLGILEGTDKKDEYVFLTAHYDHLGKRGDRIYYGADDDGSGTVSVPVAGTGFCQCKKSRKRPPEKYRVYAGIGRRKRPLGVGLLYFASRLPAGKDHSGPEH